MRSHAGRQCLDKREWTRSARGSVWPSVLLGVAFLAGSGLGCGGSSSGLGDGSIQPSTYDSGALGSGGIPGTGGEGGILGNADSGVGDDSGHVPDAGGVPGTGGAGAIPGNGGALGSGGTGAGGSGPKDGGEATCGDPGFPCCGASQCNGGGCCVSGICMAPGGLCVGLGGGTCNAGACGACGGLGLPCCGADPSKGSCTAPATQCNAGFCAKCGDLGSACCAGPSGGAGTCTGAGILCNNNLCVACGLPGTACCPGNQCTSPACCSGNMCIGENAACGTASGTCQAGRCSGCGASGQACCATNLCYDGLSCKNGSCSSCGHTGESCCPAGGTPAGGMIDRCQAGTACMANGSDTLCARCGGLGDICCAGDACAEGCCSGGRCLAVSGACPTVPPTCGNATLSADETCDDGNNVGGDGCSSTCQVEPGADCPLPGQACVKSICGNGKVEKSELCDCGTDPTKLPAGCKGTNGLFYGDGKGCSKTCTNEPNCRDGNGLNQACEATCGDGNLDPGEECDDGNLANGDGCSSTCGKETGFLCDTRTLQDSSTCQSGAGNCLELPIIYRDFQPENVTGGHPDFLWLGAQTGGQVTDWCVPNSGGPSKGNDSRARCWDLVAPDLVNGKPQYNSARASNLCDCQNTDWNINNSSRIKGGYTEAESPLYDPSTAAYRTGVTLTTAYDIPTWSGQVPTVKSADTFNQWFNDDSSVNQTFTGIIELPAIGTNIYQYASKSHLMDGGFFPLDDLNPSQKTLCNMWPYWHAWTTCSGDQYLMPPRVVQSDCPAGTLLSSGCWVTGLTGKTHNSYFTDEARYFFVYDASVGISLQFYGDDDLFIFINGKLVLDLGGVHQQLPGKVTVSGNPGDATVVEGGCLDPTGNITGASAGSTACSPTNTTPAPPTAKSPDDFRTRAVSLGLVDGKTYEIAIFGADRHPPESNFQLTLNGYTTKRSVCTPRCGDNIVSASEECDNGSQNNDTLYGGCTSLCKLGPFCGDGVKNGPEECDLAKHNGDTSLGKDGCNVGCTKPHYCGDGIVDASLEEECDLGPNNGQAGFNCSSACRVVQ